MTHVCGQRSEPEFGRVSDDTGLSQAEPQSAVGLDPTGFDPSRWLEIGAEHLNTSALLYLGESIPDLPHLMVGTRISGEEAEHLGYREFAKYGGWLIWHGTEADDFHIIDCDKPRAWLPLDDLGADQSCKHGMADWHDCPTCTIRDAIATEARRAETENTGSVHEGAGPKDIAQGGQS